MRGRHLRIRVGTALVVSAGVVAAPSAARAGSFDADGTFSFDEAAVAARVVAPEMQARLREAREGARKSLQPRDPPPNAARRAFEGWRRVPAWERRPR